MAERKEWCRVNRAANGHMSVSLTLLEGGLSVRWSVRVYGAKAVKSGVTEARRYAEQAMTELQEALDG